MKFLADMGMSITTVRALRKAGHDVEHLSELGLIRMADRDIVEKAAAECRVVLTFDLDFGEIMALSGRAAPSVILFRTGDQTPGHVTPLLFTVIEQCGTPLIAGAFVTLDDRGYRVRTLPIRRD